jgi:rSAM/selenodomain-associated transferase 1
MPANDTRKTRGPALGILTRAPEAGRTKTRLATEIGGGAAADLAAAMLLDAIDSLSGACQTTLFVEPPEGVEAVSSLLGRRQPQAPPGTQPDMHPQGPGDIGARMAAAASVLLDAGWGPIVLVGSDIPGLHRAQISAALEALSEPLPPAPGAAPAAPADIVFGPTDDGGYYLVGIRQLRPGREELLFAPTIAWGTGAVLTESKAAAKAATLRVTCVDAQEDIDTVADLVRLRTRLATASSGLRVAGPRTRAIVVALDLDAWDPDRPSQAAGKEQQR